jgi:hypothetical protein
MKILSLDLLQRILRAYNSQGSTRDQVARRFSMPTASTMIDTSKCSRLQR